MSSFAQPIAMANAIEKYVNHDMFSPDKPALSAPEALKAQVAKEKVSARNLCTSTAEL